MVRPEIGAAVAGTVVFFAVAFGVGAIVDGVTGYTGLSVTDGVLVTGFVVGVAVVGFGAADGVG